jgi:hypothetical protein
VMRRRRRLAVLVGAGGMMFQFGGGCQDFGTSIATSVRDTVAAAAVDLFNRVLLQPVVDTIVATDEV